MALTDQAIGYVRGKKNVLEQDMSAFANVAQRVVDNLKENAEFAKYLLDTASGALMFNQLTQLLEAINQARQASMNVTSNILEGFLNRQQRINDMGK